MTCDNCGDGSGWTRTWMTRHSDGTPELVWWACADCNDDEKKPKPKACDLCGLKETDCGGHAPAPEPVESWAPTP